MMQGRLLPPFGHEGFVEVLVELGEPRFNVERLIKRLQEHAPTHSPYPNPAPRQPKFFWKAHGLTAFELEELGLIR
jgi:hypothetical protein